MMQVYKDLSYFILPLHLPTKRESFKNLAQTIDEYEHIVVLGFKSENLIPMTEMIGKSPSMKVMDCFYFFDFGIDTEGLYQSFFDYIAPRYESLINKGLNIDLIRNYLNIIKEQFLEKENINVLDLGSGSGISISVKATQQRLSSITLYGYENSKKMEKRSKQAGLKMFNNTTLPKQQDYFFDAMFGSYSFHFFSGHSLFTIIWQKLRIGGILIANFHKGIGVKNALDFFGSVGAEIEILEKYGNSEVYLFRKTAKPFITRYEAIKIIEQEKSDKFQIDVLVDYLLSYSIIPSYIHDGSQLILEGDIIRFRDFFYNLKVAGWDYGSLELYDQIFSADTGGIKVEFSSQKKPVPEGFNPALLITLLSADDGLADDKMPMYFPVENCLQITVRSTKLKQILLSSNEDSMNIESSRATYFANSASYMGSKKALRHFLFSAIKCTIPASYQALDLMCGAGAVASALAMRYKTFVSDAMQFSRVLAVVQGSGFTVAKAQLVQEKLKFFVKENQLKLKDFFEKPMSLEDSFFHQRINTETKLAYNIFCEDFSFKNRLYRERYAELKSDKPQDVYELFSLAYSNTFFGIKQTMQIDSLRYAIDCLEDELDKTWALGTLIATVSAVGNTYAGHFAQPKYKDTSKLSDIDFIRLIEQRSLSVLSEFEARFIAFAHESESKDLAIIHSITGPWPEAMKQFIDLPPPKEKFVYVDAPYTRDEYSRYYHVLETLMDYQYYNLTGLGLIPDKKTSSRFKSNFFTRNVGQLKSEFTNLFYTALKNDVTCGWSYSDKAAADCLEIIYETVAKTNCDVQSFEIPYQYKGQGGRSAKHIKEYFVIFTPK